LSQGGYDAGYFYECAIGPQAETGSQIVATEPLQALPIEDSDDVPATCVKIRFQLSTVFKLDIMFHKVTQRCSKGVVGYLITALLHIFHKVCQ